MFVRKLEWILFTCYSRYNVRNKKINSSLWLIKSNSGISTLLFLNILQINTLFDFQRDIRRFLLFFHPTGVHPTLVFMGVWNLKRSRRTEFLYWIMVKNHLWKYIFFNKTKLFLKNINFYLGHPKWKHFFPYWKRKYSQ